MSTQCAQKLLSDVPSDLVWGDDSQPAIRRRAGKGFTHRTSTGRRLTNKHTLRRIKALAIPPAWSDVWICPDAAAHLQATGRDAKGRKQYRCHAQLSRRDRQRPRRSSSRRVPTRAAG